MDAQARQAQGPSPIGNPRNLDDIYGQVKTLGEGSTGEGMNNPINRMRLMADYLGKRATCKGMPLCCSIEVTSRCNLNCMMCERALLDRPERDMDKDLFFSIMDDGKDFLEMVYLNAAGEPCLNPQLPEMADRCRQNGIITQVPTNATCLNKELASDLLDAGVNQFLIGMEGATKKTYEAVRRGACFEETVNNIHALIELKQKKQSRASIVIQMVVFENNKHEADLLRQLWSIPGVDGVRLKADERPGSLQRKGQSVFAKKRHHCLFSWQGPLWINADGDLMRHGYGHSDPTTGRSAYSEVLCEGFPKRDWSGIFNGPEMIALRENQINKKLSLCGPCEQCAAFGPPPSIGWATFIPNNGRLKLAMRSIENFMRFFGMAQIR